MHYRQCGGKKMVNAVWVVVACALSVSGKKAYGREVRFILPVNSSFSLG